MLKLNELHSYYGASHVLHGVDLEVKKGDVVVFMGAGDITKLCDEFVNGLKKKNI